MATYKGVIRFISSEQKKWALVRQYQGLSDYAVAFVRSQKGAGPFNLSVNKHITVTIDGVGPTEIDLTSASPDLETAGYQAWGFQTAKTLASSTGLANTSTAYSASITIDGLPVAISVVGSSAQTVSTLIDEINADLTSTGTATFTSTGNGAILVTSATTGLSSSVLIADTDLFSSLNDINDNPSASVPGTDDESAMTLPEIATAINAVFADSAYVDFGNDSIVVHGADDSVDGDVTVDAGVTTNALTIVFADSTLSASGVSASYDMTTYAHKIVKADFSSKTRNQTIEYTYRQGGSFNTGHDIIILS